MTSALKRKGARGSGAWQTLPVEAALDEIAEAFDKAEARHGAETVWPYYYAGTMGLVQRDGINRLRHVKNYSGQFDTTHDEDIMARIVALMDQTARRLEVHFDAGEETQALQREVLKQLDDAIKLAASQTRKSSAQQSTSESDRRRRRDQNKKRNSDKSRNEKGDSKGQSAETTQAGRKPATGSANDGDDLVESRRGWGNLPQRERDEVIQGAGEKYLDRYRKWIEQYYRALQEAEK